MITQESHIVWKSQSISHMTAQLYARSVRMSGLKGSSLEGKEDQLEGKEACVFCVNTS